MKRALVTLTLLTCICGAGPSHAEPVPPDVAAKDFAAANDRALEGDPKGAVGLYRSLIERGVEHPEVYYNLGTALARDGQDVPAVIAFERALRLDPALEDAKANLQAVRERIGRPATPANAADAGSVALTDVLAPLVAATSVHLVAWATVFAQLLLFGGWWLTRRTPQGRRRVPVTITALGAALTLLFGALTVSHALVRSEAVAIALDAHELRQGPDGRFDTSSPVAAGARLKVVERDGAWLKVLQADGTSGWIRADQTTEL